MKYSNDYLEFASSLLYSPRLLLRVETLHIKREISVMVVGGVEV